MTALSRSGQPGWRHGSCWPRRKLALERGVDLSTVSGSGPGSGPGGRIVRADIENAARQRGAAQPVPPPAAPAGPARPSPGSPSAAPLEGVIPSPIPSAAAPLAPAADAEEIPLTTVRRLTAQRLAASAREARTST